MARVAVAAEAASSRVASLRELGGFSAYLVGHRLLFYLHQNADRFLIGRSSAPPRSAPTPSPTT